MFVNTSVRNCVSSIACFSMWFMVEKMGNEEGPQTYIDSTSCDVLLMTRFIVDKRSVDHTRDENALSVVNFTQKRPAAEYVR